MHFTMRFRKLLTNSFQTLLAIPEVHYELGNFITLLSIKLWTWKKVYAELHWEVNKFTAREIHVILGNRLRISLYMYIMLWLRQ